MIYFIIILLSLSKNSSCFRLLSSKIRIKCAPLSLSSTPTPPDRADSDNSQSDADGDNALKSNEQLYNSWMRDSNKIEYIVGPLTQQFSSLEELGISVTRQKNITIIPFHLTSSSDLFCNRELNMEQIECVGFDMDFTLAQYKEDFDLLAYNGATNLLVETMNYPSELYSYKYKQTMYRRGCLIDKKRGNVIKLDRFKYVRIAEHGLTKLSSADRKSIYKYNHEGIMEMEKSSNYERIDTPFSLIDACLFSQLVDLKDRLGSTCDVLSSKSYEQLWNDCRKCVDKCHKNGAIKLTVAENPSKYIIYDPNSKYCVLYMCLFYLFTLLYYLFIQLYYISSFLYIYICM